MTVRPRAWALVALAAMASLSGCSSDKPKDPGPTPGSAKSSSVAPASPTLSAAAQGALIGAQAYWDYVQAAIRDPDGYTANDQSATVALGDAQTGIRQELSQLQIANHKYQGSADQARLKVTTDASTGVPPTVIVSNCPLKNASSHLVDMTTGAEVPFGTKSAGDADPPWPRTVKMMPFNDKWLVASDVVDTSKTCTP